MSYLTLPFKRRLSYYGFVLLGNQNLSCQFYTYLYKMLLQFSNKLEANMVYELTGIV